MHDMVAPLTLIQLLKGKGTLPIYNVLLNEMCPCIQSIVKVAVRL